MRVFVPTGPRALAIRSARRALPSIAGRVIGMIDNSMPNGNALFDDIEALLLAHYGVARVIKHRKQPKGETPDDAMKAMIGQCEAIVVGMGNSGAPTSWCIRDSVRAADAGVPVVHIGTDEFRALAETLAAARGHADLPFVTVRHPFTQESRDEVRTIARRVADDIVSALVSEPTQVLPVTSALTSTSRRADLIEVPENIVEFNRFFFERGWSDGLPVIPPTPELVGRMLRYTRRAPDEVVAPIAPSGAATVEAVAINAVMAGCYPEYLPVLLAAVEAIGDQQFELYFLQNTIHPDTTWLLVNGPIAQRLKINGGVNCLGPGSWANATLGRALRLVALVIGGARPGVVDLSTLGQSGKFLMCCAENEAESPWEPFHVEHGYSRDVSTATVIAAKAPLSFTTHTQDIDDFLKIIGNAMTGVTDTAYRAGGGPALVLSPEHAHLVARAGLNKAEFKRRVWEAAKLPISKVSLKEQARTQEERRAELGEFGPDTLLPPSRKPDDIIILVAGGKGMLSAYIPCHAPISWPVTRVIDEWVPAES